MLFKLIDSKGSINGDEEIVYNSSSNDDHFIYLALNKQTKHLRLVNSSTKTRGMVNGGGAKPYRQKGTGNARQGTRRSPLRVGGGVVFGPSPRVRRYKCSKSIIKQSILSSLNSVQTRYVLDSNSNNTLNKTRDVVGLLNSLECSSQTVLFVTTTNDISLTLAARNLNNVKLSNSKNLLIGDLLSVDAVLFTSDAFNNFKEVI